MKDEKEKTHASPRAAIEEAFNRIAEEYDANRRKFIPCFDAYYAESTDAAATLAGNPKKILDLGAGTGLLSMYWYRCFPDAEYCLCDIADAMLSVARRRFSGMENVRCQIADYSQDWPNGAWDTVISALSIHHLEDEAKEALFRRICTALPEGGCFFNYDQFCFDDEAVNEVQNTLWYQCLGKSGLTKDDIARWQERKKLDRECSVESELAMLRRSGFAMAECLFQSGKFAVIAARKQQ